jgi:hypothetical protein
MIGTSRYSVNRADLEPSGVWMTRRELAEVVGCRLAKKVMEHAHHRDRRGVRVIEFSRAADLASLLADRTEVDP